MTSFNHGLSVVVPVFNEEDSIIETFEGLLEILSKLNDNFEIIAVNDGSSDTTAALLSSMHGINVMTHSVNKGYGAALKTGIRSSQYDTICITDADGTYPNDRIIDLYETYVARQLDMVVGERTGENVTYSKIRKIPKFFIIALANYICDSKIKDINSGLRIFNKEIALKFFNLYPNGFSFTTTITMSMISKGYDVEFVPINYYHRDGKSKISPIKDTLRFFQLINRVAFYFNPLKIFMPVVYVMFTLSAVFLYRDVFVLHDLTQSSVLFPILTVNTMLLGLLADMISKK